MDVQTLLALLQQSDLQLKISTHQNVTYAALYQSDPGDKMNDVTLVEERLLANHTAEGSIILEDMIQRHTIQGRNEQC